MKETITRMEIERQARKLAIVDEDAAYRLLDAARIEYDAGGNPSNVEALLKDLVKAKPYLVAALASQWRRPCLIVTARADRASAPSECPTR